ncbi:MAG: UDP-N-acetylglucosamine 1-carboxyvinyltransferase [Candidatus Shapirobacteria bacterium GW2011_GWE1_38_10]|uniref:UDP-N-acetylglucosamine 1-carboxyvinyltransferase n=1 Tax=Candidatus Shapirobacteria bacterium GW2011_GWE1_38_10 TaxID=1618488 RepID=A0A0G0KLQ7_9BACT|nr:MAG: UDP-N-acetylglucosamine 1-carboxyvinyltransferase [Candidatus Shapirobacteria bacterium GW2011_GWF2_37_20]KKQ50089.1 MAG: UDP-N-acetylglucosamine 1-carboxyvinyltransferase [Candidatus Shapirobacteria bacterium GW2011_GWE1_38_10]KKQ65262.1 MAG: UDP-N-acetylglucosamine 1-carboxyvinyltransferase [Candidatus Shapirobacteria bacterium GW2011_GWF1_38_23]HBP51160.1 UDP-N-acetylglucosamine 1-carboxyvinyltransferase [Candidatus Shapirobacteria bacterium]
MSRYIINGGQSLSGEVSIRGAKNAGYKQIIASLLSDKPSHINNIPQISDVKITQSIAESLGSQITRTGEHSLTIHTPKFTSSTVPHGTGEKSRTSFIFAAPLLSRTGMATIPTPGGDKLGARPLDRLFDCFSTMGINTELKDDLMIFKTDGIKATHYVFNKPSHTVTEVVVMTAALATGQSIFENTALEPEIDDLISMLNSMGAKIQRSSQNPKTIIVDGVPSLSGTSHQVISDRNEAITFACAALATKGSVNILRTDPKIIKTFLDTVEKMGAQIDRGSDEVAVSWVKQLKAVDIETGPEPGFMTDWQAIFSVLLTQAIGVSSIIEKVYPSRFQHLQYLEKMGVKTVLFNPKIADPSAYYEFNPDTDKPEYLHGVRIYGPVKLKPSQFSISDLRAGACITLAALTAEGESIIDNVEFIERGYEKLAERLCSLGANIKYIKT